MRNLLFVALAGKNLRVREPACDTKQNALLGKNGHVDAEIHQRLYKSLALTEAK